MHAKPRKPQTRLILPPKKERTRCAPNLCQTNRGSLSKSHEIAKLRQFWTGEVLAVTHLKSHKNSATLLHILATAQARQNKTEAALTNFRRATQSDPKSAIIHNDLGRFLLDLGRPVEAIEELRRALINDENMAAAMLNLARARLDQNDDAIILARKACKTDPAQAEAHSLYARLLITAARDAEAICAYQKAIDHGEASAQNYAMMARAQGVLT